MSQEDRNRLHNELASLFHKARAAAAQRISEQGWPFTTKVVEQSVIRESGSLNNWRTEPREVNHNILGPRSQAPTFLLAPLLTPELTQIASQCASEILTLPESNLPFWSAFAGRGWFLTRSMSEGMPPYSEYTEAPVEWVMYRLLLPALDYHLSLMPNVNDAGEYQAEQFAADVLDTATAVDLSYRAAIPLAGLDIGDDEATIKADGVIIRRLSVGEQGEFLDQEWRPGNITLSVPTPPLVSLEIPISTDRQAQNPNPVESIYQWLCALQLHGYKVSGRYATFESNPSWRMAGTSHMPISLPSMVTDWSKISRDDLTSVQATVRKLRTYNLFAPHSTSDLALHRFRLGAARNDVADAILDFTIALEALLLPYDENARQGDLGYRFRTHGAHYLAASINTRRTTAKKLSELYSVRSRLVHGSKYPNISELMSSRTAAEELARQGLLRALNEGFPTVESFRDMVLGL